MRGLRAPSGNIQTIPSWVLLFTLLKDRTASRGCCTWVRATTNISTGWGMNRARAALWGGLGVAGGWEAGCDPAMCTHSPERKLYPGLHQKAERKRMGKRKIPGWPATGVGWCAKAWGNKHYWDRSVCSLRYQLQRGMHNTIVLHSLANAQLVSKQQSTAPANSPQSIYTGHNVESPFGLFRVAAPQLLVPACWQGMKH